MPGASATSYIFPCFLVNQLSRHRHSPWIYSTIKASPRLRATARYCRRRYLLFLLCGGAVASTRPLSMRSFTRRRTWLVVSPEPSTSSLREASPCSSKNRSTKAFPMRTARERPSFAAGLQRMTLKWSKAGRNSGGLSPRLFISSLMRRIPVPFPSAGEPAPSRRGARDMSFMRVVLRQHDRPSARSSHDLPHNPPGFTISILSSKTSTATASPSKRAL